MNKIHHKESETEHLYAHHAKIYPRSSPGLYRLIKDITMSVLLGIYFIGPWLRWDRGPHAPNQAFLVDLSEHRIYLLTLEFWPQEIYYLTALLILGAVGLFFATALLGRIWCGFTCIQTVFTDLFVKVERLFEGHSRNTRIRFNTMPWSMTKIFRKSGKWIAWLILSLATGATWVFYFSDAPTTACALLTGKASLSIYGFTALVAGLTFLLAGWAREQVCIYMCPWPRFQSSMYDEDTLVITYEHIRGEPRGPAKKGLSFDGRGHCVDCTLCVQACPTGIDIRDGSQLACIGCGLCIDACNNVMDRLGLPRGLIAYDSARRQNAKARGQKPTAHRFIRPRTIAYILLLLALVIGISVGLITRSHLELNILHDRNPLFITLSDGSIRNGYTLKILNMRPDPQTFRLSLKSPDNAVFKVIGFADQNVTSIDIPVQGDSVGEFRVYVTVSPHTLPHQDAKTIFHLENTSSGETREEEELFAGPHQ